jgi:hypothetical protein
VRDVIEMLLIEPEERAAPRCVIRHANERRLP